VKLFVLVAVDRRTPASRRAATAALRGGGGGIGSSGDSRIADGGNGDVRR